MREELQVVLMVPERSPRRHVLRGLRGLEAPPSEAGVGRLQELKEAKMSFEFISDVKPCDTNLSLKKREEQSCYERFKEITSGASGGQCSASPIMWAHRICDMCNSPYASSKIGALCPALVGCISNIIFSLLKAFGCNPRIFR